VRLLGELDGRARVSSRKIIGLCLLTGAIVFALDIASPRGVVTPVLYVLVVLFSLWGPDVRLTWIVAIAASALAIIGFFVSPLGADLWIAVCNRLIELMAVWITAALSLQRKMLMARSLAEQRKRAEAVEQLKVLQGILPICASCKKIRDDQGAWNQMEAYIRDHSEADFSHGLCPQCARRMYPEFSVG
jgi:hypothetical protein